MNRRGGRARTPLAIAVLFLLALIPFALYRGSHVPEAAAAWWNSSWQYRQSIAVTNNMTEQTNVYISISLDTSNTSKFQADCGDLRFTKQNGQLLPYYIVSGCGTASTSVHIQLDTFPAGAQTLFAYYGNPSADNGFSSADFLMAATSYAVGGTGSEEVGPGPVAYWKFDEGTGSTANDSAGSNQGTITGATWTGEDQCVSGKCLSFDGGDYASFGNQSALDFGTDDFTIALWLKASSTTNSRGILSKGAYPGGGYNLWLEGGTNKIILHSNDGSSANLQTSNGVDLVSDWNHIAVSVDRDGNSKIYVNGKSQSVVGSVRPGILTSSSYSLQLAGTAGYFNRFSGLIDEVKIFPYALTEDQIKVEYNLGAAAVMGTGPTVAPPASGTLSNSLVAHWAFDEQYGQTAHDKVGNNHGTFGASTSPGSDDPTWAAAGECKVNGCLGFDGVDDHTPIGVINEDNLSWSAWFKTTASTNQALFGSNFGNASTFWHGGVIVNSAGKLVMEIGYIDSNYRNVTGTKTVNDGAWHHVVFASDAGGSYLYVDGKLDASSNYYVGQVTAANPQVSAIGVKKKPSATDSQYFNGLIDEVKIYNTALTADQVKQDMNAGASVAYGVGSDEADELADGAGTPPIAEWKFDEKQGTVAYDSSGNANDGTVNGATWKSGCQQGACLVFDGVDDNVLVSSLSSNVTGKTLTMSAWIELKNSGIQRAISASGTSTSFGFNGFNLYVHTRTSLGDDTNTPYMSLPTNCQAGWHYFSITWDTTLPSDNVKVYCDATNVGSGSLSNALNGDFNISSIMIGYGSSDQSIDGRIDHVKIYDYARTPAQIAYDYNRGAPVAHWKFDECEGTVAHDASGNENHGTWNGAGGGTQTSIGTCSTAGTGWGNGATGKYEGSLNFDDTDDHVRVTPDPTQNLSAFSIAAWVKLPAYTPSDTVLGNWQDLTTLLRITSGGTLEGYFRNPSSVQYGGNFNALSIPLNQWAHVTMTFNGTQLKGFVNGIMGTTVFNTGSPTSVKSASSYLGIGGANRTSSEGPFNGQIDDVRLYNYALSPAQIQKVMNEGFGVKYGPVIGNQ